MERAELRLRVIIVGVTSMTGDDGWKLEKKLNINKSEKRTLPVEDIALQIEIQQVFVEVVNVSQKVISLEQRTTKAEKRLQIIVVGIWYERQCFFVRPDRQFIK